MNTDTMLDSIEVR